jgi:peptidoglycan/LPS O-acetylase OafA/YrhL
MVIKVVVHVLFPGSLVEVAIHVTRFHCMMIGAAGAVFYHRKDISMIRMVDNKFCQAICWVVILLAAVNRFHIASVIDNEIISVITLCIIVGQIGVVNRVINLEGKIFDFLGRISYGVYVIHPLVILLFSLAFGNPALPVPLKYAVVYLGITGFTIGIAYVSYVYFENYFLKLKKDFTIVKSSASRAEQQ